MTNVVDQTTKSAPNTDLLIFKSHAEYQNYANLNADKVLVVYDNGVFDVTEFLETHPGGDDIIKDCNGRDITDLFHSSYPHQHSTSAVRMLAKLKIGEIKGKGDESSGDNTANLKGSNKQDVQAYPVVTADYIQYKDFRISRKEGFIGQIFGLSKEQYLDFIHHPLHLDEANLFTW
eukprot:CAMPEP_0176436260 /NCGR_PEP_ID=MMETSP0127-20121128/17856_1 /TAXON_ID=938130 /ORGANISM="Platyophrya macrostoma, Strain WH" /LENGTH=175 /DNA_ID=CAMNT_0017819533 /DNA_START=46 /DNA_END=570 /DNA_ORIENTATION=+